MTLQFHPITLGVMLVVAAGTLVYTLWNSNRNSNHRSHGQSDRNYSRDYDFEDISSTRSSLADDDERPYRRKRNIDRCAICLGPLKFALKALTCTHIFHENCIQKWLINNKTCPICRTETI
ncbi:hypothetical protein NQ314_005887 [Rhamnusium bicolor]|uniref:RING-type E3 ubiquitin transferase n=1 Tax=Rhamnusium bicolor TaxID=1586634 RepID=A0AAV8ZB91_9CUCU|nr:hypothetical protein NQ314_005887 [Rhamnusium bicolor]